MKSDPIEYLDISMGPEEWQRPRALADEGGLSARTEWGFGIGD